MASVQCGCSRSHAPPLGLHQSNWSLSLPHLQFWDAGLGEGLSVVKFCANGGGDTTARAFRCRVVTSP